MYWARGMTRAWCRWTKYGSPVPFDSFGLVANHPFPRSGPIRYNYQPPQRPPAFSTAAMRYMCTMHLGENPSPLALWLHGACNLPNKSHTPRTLSSDLCPAQTYAPPLLEKVTTLEDQYGTGWERPYRSGLHSLRRPPLVGSHLFGSYLHEKHNLNSPHLLGKECFA